MYCHECGARKAEGALYCVYCGTPLAAQPEQLQVPQTRMLHSAPVKPARRGLLRRGSARLGAIKRGLLRRRLIRNGLMASAALFALVIGCAGVSAIVDDGGHVAAVGRAAPPGALEDERAGEARAADEAGFEIPEQQAAFIRTVKTFSERYQEAENDLQSSAQRAQRRAALAKLLPDRSVQRWSGTLESLDTDARGNAYITIEPDGLESMTIATWDNALADAGAHSMIRAGSELYDELAQMREGERVTFSGTFAADDQDHIAEGSLTEDEAMTTPDFVMVFSDVTTQE